MRKNKELEVKLIETHRATLPALPGFVLIEPTWEKGKLVGIGKSPIIAWSIESTWLSNRDPYSFLVPVTIHQLSDFWAIQQPSGVISIIDDRDFNTEEELFDYWMSMELEKEMGCMEKRPGRSASLTKESVQ